MKHTPGPWQVIKGFGAVLICDQQENCVSHVMGYEHAERSANARLIAAAPDLLWALQALVIHYDGADPEGAKLRAAARAAIKKATET